MRQPFRQIPGWKPSIWDLLLQSFSEYVAKSLGLEYVNKIVHDKSKWVVVPDAHPPIIPEELFERVNKDVPIVATGVNQHFYRSSFLLTGLIKCAKCGFNYQGHNHKSSGSRHYVCGGFVNRGKSVCGWFSVRQDVLEGFVKAGIKEILNDQAFRRKVEECIAHSIDGEPAVRDSEAELVDAQLRDVELKIRHLVYFAERGMNLDSVASRINDLELQQKELRSKQSSTRPAMAAQVDRKAVNKAVCQFFEDFERNFDEAPQVEKMEMVRKIVEKIIVDPEARKVTVYFRQIPKIDDSVEVNRDENILLGAECSAKGNLRHPVCEMYAKTLKLPPPGPLRAVGRILV